MTSNHSSPERLKYDLTIEQISCPVLKQNVENFSKQVILRPELPNSLRTGNTQDLISLVSPYFEDQYGFNLYKNRSHEISKELKIQSNELSKVIERLESLAFFYIAGFQSFLQRKDLLDMLAKISDFAENLEKCLSGVDRDNEVTSQVLTSLTFDKAQSDIYANAFNKLFDANETIKTLPDFIKNSPVMRTLQVGKRSPLGYPILHQWTKSMLEFWEKDLGRTLENKNDGLNGRKHLLNFLEICIEPLHEAIEFDTLNNSLRKVQNSIRL